MRRSPLLALCLSTCALAACRPAYDGDPGSEELIDGVELLVIAPEETAEAFGPFVDWKRMRGIPTRLEILEDLDANESGEDLGARVRARIQRAWEEEGTRWVVLGADAPEIPIRRVDAWVDVDFEGAYYEGPVQSDLYYADLDGDWDGDGDGNYGEPGDGMDLFADVALGRIPARGVERVESYVDKLFEYERWPNTDYQQSALLMGEWAGEASGLTVYSSAALETMIVPLFPDEFEITRLYEDHDSYEGSIPNTRDNQIEVFEDGRNLVLNFGHGVQSYLGNLSLENLWDLENTDRPAIFTTTECSGCDIENEYVDHSACEAYVLSRGGGVAYLGNTHVGIGFPSLLEFYMAFFEEIFDDELQLSLGERIMASHLAYTTPEALAEEGSPDRWTSLVMVLMGDPTIVPWRVTPAEPEVSKVTWYRHDDGPVGCHSVTLAGEPVQGATLSWYQADSMLRVATTNGQGEACLQVPDDASGELLFTVTGPDLLPVERTLRL